MEKEAKANVIPKRQRTQYSCMTASVSMCLQALGHPNADEDTVNKTLGALPMRGACWEQALACCNHYGFRSTLIVPATLPLLKQYTDQGFPIVIAYNPEGKDWSHASVIFDIDDDLNVHIADPNMADPDDTVRVMSKGAFYKVWNEPYNGYTIRRPAMIIQPEISSDGHQLLASYFKKSTIVQGETTMSKNASDLGKLSEELSLMSEQMIMGKKKPKKSQPTNTKEKKKLVFTPERGRNEIARDVAVNRSKGDGSGAHKNKQDFARGKERNPKHKNQREYSQQSLSTRPDYGVRNAELEEQTMKLSELDRLSMELEARILSKEGPDGEKRTQAEINKSKKEHFPNGSPDINKVRENSEERQGEMFVSEQEIDAVEDALMSMMENGEMEKMALLNSDIDRMLTNLEYTLKTGGDKTAMTRKQKENAIAKKISPSDKKGKGDKQVIMLTGDLAKSIGKKNYHSQKMIDFTDKEIDDMYSLVSGKKASRTRMTDRTANTGLYGFTKGVQKDCESAIRKVSKTAATIAKQLWSKDESTCAFLNTHAKRSKSVTAKVILAAMTSLGPKVATYSEETPNIKLAGKSGYGLYGFKSKTANLGLGGCSLLKTTVGEVTADLHSKRTAKRENIVSFLTEHRKVGKCVYSRLMLSAYPDGSMKMASLGKEFVPDTVQGWIEWEN